MPKADPPLAENRRLLGANSAATTFRCAGFKNPHPWFWSEFSTGAEGIEPPTAVLETAVIPLN
jgi:hypothetical protein